MKIYHLSCGSLCPFGGHWVDGFSPGFSRAHLACHCLLLETNQGLVLVDTGFGMADVEHRRQRIPAFLRSVCRPRLHVESTALRQIQALGYKARDVRHIVLTHLDVDHAGGLSDFPHAEVHLSDDEYDAALFPEGWLARRRYQPEQWSRRELWHRYRSEGEQWFGFPCVRELRGLPPEILLIPLPGHTFGHCGVAAQGEDGHWQLLAGDAYYHHSEMHLGEKVPGGIRFLERIFDADRPLRLENQRRLRELARDHQAEITIFCSHDREEYRHLRKDFAPPLRLPGQDFYRAV